MHPDLPAQLHLPYKPGLFTVSTTQPEPRPVIILAEAQGKICRPSHKVQGEDQGAWVHEKEAHKVPPDIGGEHDHDGQRSAKAMCPWPCAGQPR
jgi:hypothetical protein